MKIFNYFKISLLISVLALGLWSCSSSTDNTSKATELQMPTIHNQAGLLLKFFAKSGDYFNAPHSPYLMHANDVMAEKDNYLLLDIRYHEDYVEGHVEGAINIDRESIIPFLNTLKGFYYDKIIIIDNTGQGAAYVASVLRAIGYGNAYAMKFGMSAWNPKFSYHWTQKVGDKPSLVTKEETPKGSKGSCPTITTKGKSISEILMIRAKEEINANFSVTIENLEKDLSDYYIVNYWPKAKYEEAHLQGAIWYQPKKSINIDEDICTLPTDKKILVYCYTGQNGSALVAYLRILGYDAYNLRFGTNSFMYKTDIANGWNAFVANKDVNTFPFITGSKPSKEKEAKTNKIENPNLNFKHREVIHPKPDEVCD